MAKCLLSLLLLLAFCFNAQQLQEPVFHHIEADRFNSTSISSPYFNSKGLFWSAYKEGIICFDGYSPKKIPADKKIILSKNILTYFLDAQDILWIAYADTFAITRFNTNTYESKHFTNDKVHSYVPEYPITAFKQDSKGRFWLLTWGGGLYSFDKASGKTKQFLLHTNFNKDEEEYANRIKDFAELPDGTFFVSIFANESKKLMPHFFDPSTQKFTVFNFDDYLQGLNSEESTRILMTLKICHFSYYDNNNGLWLGTYSGLVYVDLKNKMIRRISPQKNLNYLNLDNIRCYAVDEQKRLWTGTPNAGIMLVDMVTKKARYLLHDSKNTSSLSDNRIRGMRKDAQGNIWTSTGLGGFSVYNPLVQQFKIIEWHDLKLQYSNRSDQIIPVNQMLVTKDGDIYLTGENGVSIYNIDSAKITRLFTPGKKINSLNEPTAIERVRDISFKGDKIFMTGTSVPAMYDPETNSYKRFKVYGDRENRTYYNILFRHSFDQNKPLIAIGTFVNKLFLMDLQKDSLTVLKNMDKDPGELSAGYSYILKNGKWLISKGPKEFLIYDPSNGNYKRYGQKQNYFPDSTIRMAYVDKAGSIWFGTDKGLFKFDETTGKTTHLNPVLKLKEGPVNAMIEDNAGIWWIALNQQLLRWDPKDNTTITVGSALGLQAGSFLPAIAQKDKQGRIYIASFNGALVFDPAQIKVPEEGNSIYLSNVIVKEDTFSFAKKNKLLEGNMKFNWNENYFSLEFCTNNAYSPIPQKFNYRIVGLDSAWQENGVSNRLRLTNLPHGTYTIEVRSINVFEKAGKTLRIPFTIAAPFWLRWWFYVLVLLLIIVSGFTVIKIREKAFIRKQEQLEQKIRERTAEVIAKAEEIRHQKDVIVEKNKELTDSINYAKRIQESILPGAAFMKNTLKDVFVLFKPKDIVSGDFYWSSVQKDSVLWSVVDCTGHGVPGGFMSMLGSGLLNQIVNEELKLQPDLVLNDLRDRVIAALKQTGAIGENKDGMDITFCRYIPAEKKLQMAAANNPLYIIRRGELLEFPADKQPIGIYLDKIKPFTLTEIFVETGDVIYMTTDGYADQFGGPKGKKFKSVNFEKLITSLSGLDLEDQHKQLDKNFLDWKGIYDQLDDVCVMAVKI